MAPVAEARPMQGADVGALQEWLQRHGIPRIGKDATQQALDLVARERALHPVRDYLNGLHWDGISRIDKWLSYHLGAEPSPYVAKIGRWFLIAMVARIMRPGCKCDYMLVLEGPQGSQKSAACAILAEAWFSDNLPDLHHGDQVRLSMHLRGKWLIEISEMASISRAEAGALKAFLTQTDERYTPKFGRNEVIEPRQCLFIGSTNKAAYLRDETGGRRFWPVVTGTIDIGALKHDRDQLFAEAMIAYRNGDEWWPDRDFEAEYIKPEQEARFEADAWEQAVGAYLIGKQRVTVLELAREALYIDLPKVGTADQRRITAVLEALGWKPGKRGTGGIRWWVHSAPVVTQ
jgi:predicted P-loop ATPase